MSRATQAASILHTYSLASGGAGLVTAPFLSTAAVTTLHLAMIRDLARVYEVEFSKDNARGILLALGAAFVPGWLGGGLERSLLRRLPAVTGLIGWVAMAGMSAAVTYGLGRTLIEHFESGGTLADFDVKHLHQAVKHLLKAARPAAAPPA
jgi:uncharacterized protein (DUF697 family)